MLFSNEKVADYINKNFEPAWQSVRDVPMVTIDFGKGHRPAAAVASAAHSARPRFGQRPGRLDHKFT